MDHLCYFCLGFVIRSYTSVYWCLVVTYWERDDLLTHVFDVLLWRCHIAIGILGQVWCLIVSIPDLCHLSYSDLGSHPTLPSTLFVMWPMHLWIYKKYIIRVKLNVMWNVVQYPLHHVTYAPVKFEGGMSNGLGGDAITWKNNIWPLLLNCCQGHYVMKRCPVPFTSCNIAPIKFKVAMSNGLVGDRIKTDRRTTDRI